MSNPTSNFNWQMPTATDLVTSLPADFEVFGQAVDTALMDLKGGTTGQVLAKASNTDMDFVWSADAAGMTNPMTTTGDTIYSSSGSTPARLGIGSTGQVLTVSGGVPAWATPAGGANWSLLNAGGTALTGASTITISGISGKDQIMVLVQNASTTATFASYSLRINADTAANYDSYRVQSITYDSTYAASMGSTNTVLGATSFYNGSGGNTASANYNGFWLISGCNSSGKKIYNGAGGAEGGTANQHITSAGVWNNTATVTSVSLISGANFDQGTIYVYATA